jgi:hypothetical protein
VLVTDTGSNVRSAVAGSRGTSASGQRIVNVLPPVSSLWAFTVAEAAHERESHAHPAVAARPAVVLLVEAVEEAWNRLGADADTIVDHVDSACAHALFGTRSHLDVSALRRELHRVVDERPQHLTKPERVGVDHRFAAHVDDELHRERVLEVTPHVVGGVADRALDLHRRDADVDGVRVDEREVDDILDRLAEELHGDIDVTDDVEPRRVVPLVPCHVEQFDLSLDREHRRAQLMLRRVEEVALELVQLAETAHRLTFLFECSGVLDRDCRVVGQGGQRAFIAFGYGPIRRDEQHTGQRLLVEHRHSDRGASSGVEAHAASSSELVDGHRVDHVWDLRPAAAHAQDLVATLGVHRGAG